MRAGTALFIIALAGVMSLVGVASATPSPSADVAHAAKDAKRPKKRVAGAKKPEAPRRDAKKPGAKAAAVAKAPPRSVGYPNEGRLDNGVRMDTKLPFVRVVPAYESGDVRWGLPALVGMLERAARAVNKRYPGSVLDVGDLSRREGGDVLRHHSHESGRDADIGFYVVDAKGKGVHGKTFTRVGADLKAEGMAGATYDLPRNWLFIQSLVTDPKATVSHIFVAGPLRERLLAHARSKGVSQRVIDKVSLVMMQPSDSIEHDDHYHIRISCPPTMRGTCIEMSRNAPTGASRAEAARAKKKALRTPPARVASTKRAERRDRDSAPSALSRLLPSAPSLSKNTVSAADLEEAAADAAEVKDGLDDSGTAKITE